MVKLTVILYAYEKTPEYSWNQRECVRFIKSEHFLLQYLKQTFRADYFCIKTQWWEQVILKYCRHGFHEDSDVFIFQQDENLPHWHNKVQTILTLDRGMRPQALPYTLGIQDLQTLPHVTSYEDRRKAVVFILPFFINTLMIIYSNKMEIHHTGRAKYKLHQHWIGPMGSQDTALHLWPPRSPITPCNFLLGYRKDCIFVSPLVCNLDELKNRTAVAVTPIKHVTLQKVWDELYWCPYS